MESTVISIAEITPRDDEMAIVLCILVSQVSTSSIKSEYVSDAMAYDVSR